MTPGYESDYYNSRVASRGGFKLNVTPGYEPDYYNSRVASRGEVSPPKLGLVSSDLTKD